VHGSVLDQPGLTWPYGDIDEAKSEIHDRIGKLFKLSRATISELHRTCECYVKCANSVRASSCVIAPTDFIYHRSGTDWDTRAVACEVIDSVVGFEWPSDHKAVVRDY